MARINVTQDVLVDSVLARLRSQITILNERTCYAVIDPLDIAIPKSGDFWLTVSIGEGGFDQEMMDIGAIEQCMEDAQFQVTAYNRVRTDSTGHDYQVLQDAARGLFEVKRQILKALTGHDLAFGSNTGLRALLRPLYATAPMTVVKSNQGSLAMPIGMLGITFASPFDWDLTS